MTDAELAELERLASEAVEAFGWEDSDYVAFGGAAREAVPKLVQEVQRLRSALSKSVKDIELLHMTAEAEAKEADRLRDELREARAKADRLNLLSIKRMHELERQRDVVAAAKAWRTTCDYSVKTEVRLSEAVDALVAAEGSKTHEGEP